MSITQETEYPWNGQVKLTVTPGKAEAFALQVRIPSWLSDRPVPGSDLYTFADAQKEAYTISVNGKKISTKPSHGYVEIERTWNPGDVVELNFPMEVRRIQANAKVAADEGLMAIERGPIMYCLEGIDTEDKHVFNKYIPQDAAFSGEYKADVLNGIYELSTTAKQLNDNGETDQAVALIPYSTWNNRGNAEMAVWIPASAAYARPTPKPTIASRAHSYTVVSAPIQKDGLEIERRDYCYGVNDQWDPKNSADLTKPYWYFWLKEGTEENIEYVFDKPETVQSCSVYWLQFDHYDGDYRVPASWKIQYKTAAGTWQEVEDADAYECKADTYNTVHFKPVKTSGLRLVVQLQEGESGGVIEWKVE